MDFSLSPFAGAFFCPIIFLGGTVVLEEKARNEFSVSK